MRFLPKANPLYEKLSASDTIIPDLFIKLQNSSFTGYIYHSTLKFEFYGVLAEGKLLCTHCSDDTGDKTGFEALALLCDTVISEGGELSAYRMTNDLAVSAHAQITGPRLLTGEEVRQVDIKEVLARMKNQRLNGVVRFYTTDRSAMIFFKSGSPLGFYYDNSGSIESSPDESRRIAALPDARVEICTTRPLEELLQYDLLQMVNLPKLWESAVARRAAARPKTIITVEPPFAPPDEQKLLELIDDLYEIASAYLSREGRIIVEKRIRELGGPSLLLDHEKRAHLLVQVEGDARVCDSNARVDEMIDLMRSEIGSQLTAERSKQQG